MAVSRKNNDAPKGAASLQFHNVVKKIDRHRQKQVDAGADLGNAYQEADTWGFNRIALKQALKIRNMEDDKRNDYLSSLNTYLDWLGINDQGALFGGQATGVGDGSGVQRERSEGGEASGDPAAGTEGGPNLNVVSTQGRTAGLGGERADICPYPEGSERHEVWLAGWTEGQAEAVTRNIKPLDPESKTQASA